jgi:FKBP-type peptidyl-prolyl cis-trans isomerase FkpA
MRLFILLLLAGGLFYGCGSGDTSTKTTALGTRYQLFTSGGSGEKVQPGEFVYFQAQLRSEADSVFFRTRDGGEDQTPFVQAAPEDATMDNLGPVEDVLRYMRIGDSAVVRVNMEEFPTRPPGLENDTVALYDLVVTNILTEEEFSAIQVEKEKEARAVAELVMAREADRVAFAEETLKAYQDGTLEGIQETSTGLKYVIHEEGSGIQAEAGKGVVVQYIGKLVENGNIFDQSFQRGVGIPFTLGTGRVIPGWDEGIALMKEGGQATLFIPSDLGYGAGGTPDGTIPGGAELMFYVELEEVQ